MQFTCKPANVRYIYSNSHKLISGIFETIACTALRCYTKITVKVNNRTVLLRFTWKPSDGSYNTHYHLFRIFETIAYITCIPPEGLRSNRTTIFQSVIFILIFCPVPSAGPLHKSYVYESFDRDLLFPLLSFGCSFQASYRYSCDESSVHSNYKQKCTCIGNISEILMILIYLQLQLCLYN